MHPGRGGANGVLGMHRVRQRDLDGIDRSQTLFAFVVAERLIEPIPFCNFTTFGAIAGPP
jgi:hypothetical protein